MEIVVMLPTGWPAPLAGTGRGASLPLRVIITVAFWFVPDLAHQDVMFLHYYRSGRVMHFSKSLIHYQFANDDICRADRRRGISRFLRGLSRRADINRGQVRRFFGPDVGPQNFERVVLGKLAIEIESIVLVGI